MQFDRDADGKLHPLPAPSIDTGAGLERIASVMQGVRSNYETDLFRPLILAAADRVGIPYEYDTPEGVSYRVLADHARATAFLLSDGVYPSNEGRGYVLRRILRRAVRHAWLLGRREPTLTHVVESVIELMSDVFPELLRRRDHLLRTTRAEEERFLDTIDEGMKRFDEIAPPEAQGTISGADAFRLYDTFGFPLDLTELMAAERGYDIDIEGFEEELEQQRRRSRQDRAASGVGAGDELADGWVEVAPGAEQQFLAYRTTSVDTDVIAYREAPAPGDARTALRLRQNPFYAESGGQISDRGYIQGDGWRMRVDEVRRIGGQVAVLGPIEGDFLPGPVRAEVEEPSRRDTERNHTATHLLHAALRRVLGDHVVQQGSLVAPDRLRFDFLHTGPMTPDQIAEVERLVNEAIWANYDVCTLEMSYLDAIGRGAMALFSEKYGDVVRVVEVPGISLELCGGTHVRSTGQIAALRIVSESGVAAGVRRVEAVTGPLAYERALEDRRTLRELAAALRTREDNLVPRVRTLLEEGREQHRQLERARASVGADRLGELIAGAVEVDGVRVVTAEMELESADAARQLGDQLRERLGSGVAVLAIRTGDRPSLYAIATDDLIKRGLRADSLIREVAATVGGKGGGRPHLAQAGVSSPERLPEALARVEDIVRGLLAGIPA
jgi:alanyl-tRNA synthetase